MTRPELATSTDSPSRRHVVLARWVLLVSAGYLVLYGSSTTMPLWPHRALTVAVLLANCLLTGTVVRADASPRFRWAVTAVDLLTMIVAIAVAGPSTDFFLFFFLVMLLAGFSHGARAMMALTLSVCVIYAGVLYMSHGAEIWRRTEELIRLPFLLGAAIFFSVITEETRRERRRAERFSSAAERMARRFQQVATERDRTQALLNISRAALSTDDPSTMLHQITIQVREILRLDRCSLIIFGDAGREGYLAACTDDPERDVHLLLELGEYPELQAALGSGQITEVHASRPDELWADVMQHLPAAHAYLSSTVVPLMQSDQAMGAFFLRDRRADSRLSDDEKVFCTTVATMTAAYLQGCDVLEELRRRSRHDDLTDLLNFRAFREELSDAIATTCDAGAAPLSVALIDIDDMKRINDHHGHAVGSDIIRLVGSALAESLPDSPAICRYGGDEFIAALRCSKQQAGERLRAFIERLERLPATAAPCPPRVSVGVAEQGADGGDLEQLIEVADQAMYLAKSEGGQAVRVAERTADTEAWNGKVFEAVISVNARRLIPGEATAFRGVLNQLLRLEEAQLDSDSVRQSLHALMEAVEQKDPYTCEHSREVAALARQVAEQFGLPQAEVLTIETAALVHDIGKIGVSDEVLQKRGKLTREERREIERHPEIGAQILSPLPALQAVIPLVLHHQERWDGTGYPHGLAGDDIPLGAQIIALCDVFHALTSDRAYRKAFPTDEACRIIRDRIGADWNPQVAEQLLAIVRETADGSDRLDRAA